MPFDPGIALQAARYRVVVILTGINCVLAPVVRLTLSSAIRLD